MAVLVFIYVSWFDTVLHSHSFIIVLASTGRTKRSGFVFRSTDRVTWLVNRYYCLTKISIRSSVNFPADFVCLWNPVPF